jgi:hypothetical protein
MVGAGGAEMPDGIGGFGATGAPGAAGGASEALRVTRTVSFFSGMVEVCLDGGIEEVGLGGGISFSLIARRFFGLRGWEKQPAPRRRVKPPSRVRTKPRFFYELWGDIAAFSPEA